jgi:hypothetical protein
VRLGDDGAELVASDGPASDDADAGDAAAALVDVDGPVDTVSPASRVNA